MCGRLSSWLTWEQIHDLLELQVLEGPGQNLGPRRNVAPTQDLIFCAIIDGIRKLGLGRWWLVPAWAKEISTKYPAFNAKGETVHTLTSFRGPFRSRRCLIPADGYYEWTTGADGKKDPWFIHLDHTPFCFAGVWEVNTLVAPEPLLSTTIITLPSIGDIESIHTRMPVVLRTDVWDEWLDPETPTERAHALLEENHGMDLSAYRVDRRVNATKYQGEDAANPIEESSL